MKFWKTLNRIAASIVLGTLMASCSLIEDDLPECGLDLYFRYDYNLQRADMFRDHVGSVRAYVYDANDKLVAQQTESVVRGNRPLNAMVTTCTLPCPRDNIRWLQWLFKRL